MRRLGRGAGVRFIFWASVVTWITALGVSVALYLFLPLLLAMI